MKKWYNIFKSVVEAIIKLIKLRRSLNVIE